MSLHKQIKTQCYLEIERRITMKAVNIKWDTDGDMELLEELPTEVEIPDYLTTYDEDDLLDDVSDWLSDEYGFCHDAFELVN